MHRVKIGAGGRYDLDPVNDQKIDWGGHPSTMDLVGQVPVSPSDQQFFR